MGTSTLAVLILAYFSSGLHLHLVLSFSEVCSYNRMQPVPRSKSRLRVYVYNAASHEAGSHTVAATGVFVGFSGLCRLYSGCQPAIGE